MDALDLKHAKSVLVELSKTDEVKKSDLFKIIKSHQVLDNLLESLEKDSYLIIQESSVGPKKYSISLTPKGRVVAENLMHLEEPRVTIPEGLVTEIDRIIKRDKSHSSVEEYVNEAVRKAIEKWKREHAVG
jgi:DNA-binding HxlR family transcriptional regulator